MITFIVCFVLLVAAYFVYGRYLEKLVGAEAGKPVPSKTHFDGVDYMPLPKWKTFLIQLLNIAGLGPIFGAVLGALYGPVAFIWITAGGILFGAMHDFMSGWISLENDGQSLPEIIGKYLGVGVKQVMRIFTVCLLVLLGAVFLLGPAGLLAGMTPSISLQWWIAIIFFTTFWLRCCPSIRSSDASIRCLVRRCCLWPSDCSTCYSRATTRSPN